MKETKMIKPGQSSPMVVEHWKKKFEKSIPILLKNGFVASQLIEMIKLISEENK